MEPARPRRLTAAFQPRFFRAFFFLRGLDAERVFFAVFFFDAARMLSTRFG